MHLVYAYFSVQSTPVQATLFQDTQTVKHGLKNLPKWHGEPCFNSNQTEAGAPWKDVRLSAFNKVEGWLSCAHWPARLQHGVTTIPITISLSQFLLVISVCHSGSNSISFHFVKWILWNDAGVLLLYWPSVWCSASKINSLFLYDFMGIKKTHQKQTELPP